MGSGAIVQKSWKSERQWLLIFATIAFLFIGFVKGLLWSPVDLTFIAAALVCLGLFWSPEWIAGATKSSITWLLAALAGVLIIRLLPEHTAWGVRKAAEMVALGVPAYLSGITIARQPSGLTNLARALAFAALPLAAYLVVYSITHNPYSFPEAGSAGYQLTGLFLGMGMVAAVYTGNPWCFAAAVLGVVISGNLSGAIFAGLAVVIMWGVERDWKQISVQSTLAAVAIAVYWMFVAPPLVLMRILWKVGAIVLVATQEGAGALTPEQSAAELTAKGGILGNMVVRSLHGMPAASQGYLVDAEAADRAEYYRDAIRLIGENWLTGHGYGVPKYAGELYPHNVLLETFAEAGVVAFVLTAAVLVGSLWYAARSRNLFVFGLLLTMSLTAMVSGYWGSRLLMFAIGLAVGAAALAQPRQLRQPEQKLRP